MLACRYSTYKLIFGEFDDDVVFPLQARFTCILTRPVFVLAAAA